MKIDYKGFYDKKNILIIIYHYLMLSCYTLRNTTNEARMTIKKDKTTQIQLLLPESKKEMLTLFAKDIMHASTLGGWLKALAFDQINNASPDQKQKLNELMGV